MATTQEFIEINGVKIPFIYETQKRLPVASMQIVFQNSGTIDDGNHSGLAKLSARMMNEGTKKLGAIGFARELEAKAIHLSVSTGTETMVIEAGGLSETFGDTCNYLKDLLRDPNLSEATLKKVQTQIIGSIKRKENDYDYTANVALKALLYKDTPLQNPSMGTVESVSAITLQESQNFIKKHMVLSRAIIVVGGDLNITEAKSQISDALSVLPKGEMEPLPYYAVCEDQNETILKRHTEQAYLYFGAPFDMKVNDDNYYKARVAMFILGAGGFGSRMMEEIRVKRGLAYSAYARVSVSKSHSYFMGYLQTKIESLEEARSTVDEVIDTFVKKGVSQKELDQARKFLLGSEPLRVETLSQRLSRTFMDYYKGHPLDYSKKELALIKDLKLDDLNAFIGEHQEILKLSYAIVTQ